MVLEGVSLASQGLGVLEGMSKMLLKFQTLKRDPLGVQSTSQTLKRFTSEFPKVQRII